MESVVEELMDALSEFDALAREEHAVFTNEWIAPALLAQLLSQAGADTGLSIIGLLVDEPEFNVYEGDENEYLSDFIGGYTLISASGYQMGYKDEDGYSTEDSCTWSQSAQREPLVIWRHMASPNAYAIYLGTRSDNSYVHGGYFDLTTCEEGLYLSEFANAQRALQTLQQDD